MLRQIFCTILVIFNIGVLNNNVAAYGNFSISDNLLHPSYFHDSQPPVPAYNWTLTDQVLVYNTSRSKRSTNDADDFYDVPPPTIQPNLCTTTPEEIQSVNNALFSVLSTMTDISSESRPSCVANATQSPPSSSNCQLLINYLHTVSQKIVCEYALMKTLDVVSNSNYMAMEAKYEKRIQDLNVILGKLRQQNSQSENQLRSDFNQKLQLLQSRINSLLKEVKVIKAQLQEKMIDVTVERIRSGAYAGAVNEYKEMRINREESLPKIVQRTYRSGNHGVAGRISKFIMKLAYIEECIVATRALYNQMKSAGDLNSFSVLGLWKCIKFITNQQNLGKALSELQTVIRDLEGKVKPNLDTALSQIASNIRSGQYSQIVDFTKDSETREFYVNQADTIMRAAYSGRHSVSNIIGLLNAFPYIQALIPSAIPVLKLMKENRDIYSREGVQLVYTLYKWGNVISDNNLLNEIPSSLKLFGGKKCVLKNRDKNYEFLTATYRVWYGGDRRLVVTHPNSWAEGENAKWVIESEDEGKTFTFYNMEYKEYLYAAGDNYKYDSDRRQVFTWVPKGTVNQGYWELKPDIYGDFKITNTVHGEKLYAAVNMYQDSWRRVFTWGKKSESHYDEYWKIYCS